MEFTLVFALILSGIIILLSILSVIVFDCSWWVLGETGCLENIQVVILLIALIFFVIGIKRNKQRGQNMLLLFFALLCYAFILREVDFDKIGLPDFMVFMLYGLGRHITLILGFSFALIFAAVSFREYIKSTLYFIFSKRGLYILLASAFLWLGYFFEHKFNFSNEELWEESCELIGCCCLLYSAYLCEKFSEKSAIKSEKFSNV